MVVVVRHGNNRSGSGFVLGHGLVSLGSLQICSSNRVKNGVRSTGQTQSTPG
ncbi:hypothetical protein HanXRQr2_Chr07g0288061 [Helianthus annuus]|uniref:Uncharacterized protein n=1 Tax=Helianthus annuus TaxID=4232 RepID=A0A9K3IJR8_HELAN|nr:hypothetical protein HanXRQr2_Chr07g0288061 [Helianthus annuus]KAJ0904170.1 hypothetical protein HanPSC8_Chr07g0278831 [Helianthus annuus]